MTQCAILISATKKIHIWGWQLVIKRIENIFCNFEQKKVKKILISELPSLPAIKKPSLKFRFIKVADRVTYLK